MTTSRKPTSKSGKSPRKNAARSSARKSASKSVLSSRKPTPSPDTDDYPSWLKAKNNDKNGHRLPAQLFRASNLPKTKCTVCKNTIRGQYEPAYHANCGGRDNILSGWVWMYPHELDILNPMRYLGIWDDVKEFVSNKLNEKLIEQNKIRAMQAIVIDSESGDSQSSLGSVFDALTNLSVTNADSQSSMDIDFDGIKGQWI